MFVLSLLCLGAIMGNYDAAPHSSIIHKKYDKAIYDHLHVRKGHVYPRPKKNVVISPSNYQHHCNAAYNASKGHCFHPFRRLYVCIMERCESHCSQDLFSCHSYCTICVLKRLTESQFSEGNDGKSLPLQKQPDAILPEEPDIIPPVIPTKATEVGKTTSRIPLNISPQPLNSTSIMSRDLRPTKDRQISQQSDKGKLKSRKNKTRKLSISQLSPFRIKFNLTLACNSVFEKTPENSDKCVINECSRICTDGAAIEPQEDLNRCVDECVHTFKLYLLTSFVGNAVMEPYITRDSTPTPEIVKPIIIVDPKDEADSNIERNLNVYDMGAGGIAESNAPSVNISSPETIKDAQDMPQSAVGPNIDGIRNDLPYPPESDLTGQEGELNVAEIGETVVDQSKMKAVDLSPDLETSKYMQINDDQHNVEMIQQHLVVKTLENDPQSVDNAADSEEYLLNEDVKPLKTVETIPVPVDPKITDMLGEGDIPNHKTKFSDYEQLKHSEIDDMIIENSNDFSKTNNDYQISEFEKGTKFDSKQDSENMVQASESENSEIAHSKSSSLKSPDEIPVINSDQQGKEDSAESRKVSEEISNSKLTEVDIIKTIKLPDSNKFSKIENSEPLSDAVGKVTEAPIALEFNEASDSKKLIKQTKNITSKNVIAIKQAEKESAILLHEDPEKPKFIKIVKQIQPISEELSWESCGFLRRTPDFHAQCLACLSGCPLPPEEMAPCSHGCLASFHKMIRRSRSKDIERTDTEETDIMSAEIVHQDSRVPTGTTGRPVNIDVNQDGFIRNNALKQGNSELPDSDDAQQMENSMIISDREAVLKSGPVGDEVGQDNDVTLVGQDVQKAKGKVDIAKMDLRSDSVNENEVVILRRKRKHKKFPNKIMY